LFDIYLDESSFIRMFKSQILHLVIKIIDIKYQRKDREPTNIFASIFAIFTNLNHLEFVFEDTFHYLPLSLINLSSTKFDSSCISFLNVTVHNFDDCLCLLDDRFTQLHTIIMKVEIVKNSSRTLNNKVKISNHKYRIQLDA